MSEVDWGKNISQERNDLVELLRFLAAGGIVWFHVGGPGSWIGHSSLLVFIALSVFFAVTNKVGLRRRARLLTIWLFWSLVYTMLKVLQAAFQNQQIISEFEPWMIFVGPILPLWFLPFVFIANTILAGYFSSPRIKPGFSENAALLFVLLAVLLASRVSYGPPVDQWILGIGGVAVAVSVIRSIEKPTYVATLLAVLIGAQLIARTPQAKMFILGAAISSVFLLWAPTYRSDIMNKLGSLSLGIYVLHHGVVVVLKSIQLDASPAVFAVIVLISSTILTAAFRLIPGFKWVL